MLSYHVTLSFDSSHVIGHVFDLILDLLIQFLLGQVNLSEMVHSRIFINICIFTFVKMYFDTYVIWNWRLTITR